MGLKIAFDLREAGEAIGLSPHTLRKYIRAGKITHSRIGRRIVIPAAALEELIRQGLKPARKTA